MEREELAVKATAMKRKRSDSRGNSNAVSIAGILLGRGRCTQSFKVRLTSNRRSSPRLWYAVSIAQELRISPDPMALPQYKMTLEVRRTKKRSWARDTDRWLRE